MISLIFRLFQGGQRNRNLPKPLYAAPELGKATDPYPDCPIMDYVLKAWNNLHFTESSGLVLDPKSLFTLGLRGELQNILAGKQTNKPNTQKQIKTQRT